MVTNEEVSGKTCGERDRKKTENGHIISVIGSRKKIFGILALQVYQILQLPCSNSIVDSLLKFVLTITQMDLSVVECWQG